MAKRSDKENTTNQSSNTKDNDDNDTKNCNKERDMSELEYR